MIDAAQGESLTGFCFIYFFFAKNTGQAALLVLFSNGEVRYHRIFDDIEKGETPECLLKTPRFEENGLPVETTDCIESFRFW